MQPRKDARRLTSHVGTPVSAEDDARAVDRVLNGDVAAFGAIVERWQGPMINLAYRFCHDRGRAEDMAQEAFFKAFRGLAQWRREAAFSTWLFALATNLYRTEMRRVPPRTVSLDEIVAPPDSTRRDAAMDEDDRRRAVRRVVDLLPAKSRDRRALKKRWNGPAHLDGLLIAQHRHRIDARGADGRNRAGGHGNDAQETHDGCERQRIAGVHAVQQRAHCPRR